MCSSKVAENCGYVEEWEHTVLPYDRVNRLPVPFFEAVAGLWFAPDQEIKGNGS